MMKLFLTTLLFTLLACGPESSPEGRSIIRDEHIQTQINLLKEQNQAILDSLALIRKELAAFKTAR